MNKTFYEVILKYSRKVALAESLNAIVLAWSEDYEKEWFWIHNEIPQGARYFWANRTGKYGKLFKFELIGKKWKVVEKASALSPEAIQRIRRGPAFQGVPPVLHPPHYVSWFTTWSDLDKILNKHDRSKTEKSNGNSI